MFDLLFLFQREQATEGDDDVDRQKKASSKPTAAQAAMAISQKRRLKNNSCTHLSSQHFEKSDLVR
jgi:hypothetical protein